MKEDEGHRHPRGTPAGAKPGSRTGRASAQEQGPEAERESTRIVRTLEVQVRRLTQERRAALNALELAGSMGSLAVSLNRLQSPLPILAETAMKLRTLVRFSRLAFFLVNEDDADMHLALAEPEDCRDELEAELEQLIQDHTLAWVLQRAKPVFLGAAASDGVLLLHSLSTVSRVRGVFIGVLGQPREEVPDPSHALLTIIFHACAQALESFSLYARIREMNHQLAQHVATLELSELALQERGEALEDVAARHTLDLETVQRELGQRLAELERAQADCRRHEQFLRDVLDGEHFGVLVLDADETILHCNQLARRVYGLDRMAVPGRALEEVAPPWLLARLRQENEAVRLSGEPRDGPETLVDAALHGRHRRTVFVSRDPFTGAQAVCRLTFRME